MRVIVFAGKMEVDVDYMKPAIKPNDYIIACDGGLDTVYRLGVRPDLLIGDFDSVEFRLLDMYQETNRLEFQIEKDSSDLELTFEYCKTIDCSEIVVFGAIGGRIDHALSNIGLLDHYYKEGLDIKFFDKNNEVFVTGRSIAIKKSKHYFSVLALEDDTVISLKGTKYPLEQALVSKEKTLTISNEIDGNFAFLEIHSGRVLVMQVESI